MNKSVLSVKYTLMLILITIIIVGLAGVMDWLLGFFRTNMCIQEQVKAVNDIEGLVDDVFMTGNPVIEKIKINGVCADCMWYNVSTRQIMIKFRTAATPVPINVSKQWGGVSTDWGCGPTNNMQDGQTHDIEITPYYIFCMSCP